jgi:hypothetical protein
MAVRVFVSYSRTDFPFAEAVVAQLRRAGLDPWLDVQRLLPGVNWAQEIDASLDASDAVLLLASPTAIDSDSVRHEWEWAQRRRIPVYIGVVRPVELPAELVHCPGRDLRVRPWRNIAALGRALAGTGMSTPGSDRWRRAGRVPVAVAGAVGLAVAGAALLVLAGLVMVAKIVAAGAIGGEYALPFGSVRASFAAAAVVGIPLLGVAVAVLLTVSHLGLLRRHSTLRTMGISLLASLGYCGLFAVTWLPVVPSPVPALVLTSGLLSLAGGALLWWSRTIRLWLPTGHRADPERWAFTALASWPSGADGFRWPDFRWRWRALRTRFTGLPVGQDSVDVWSAPADEPVAALLRTACRDAGFAVDRGHATWVFVLVSAHCDWSALFARVPARAICVLVDNIDLPADSAELRRYQWMDFRSQDADHLFWLLSALRAPARASDDHTVLAPVDPARYRAPLGVAAFSEVCRDVIAFLAGVTIGTLVARPFDGGAVLLAGVTALLVGSLALLHAGATRRGLTPWPLAGVAAVTALLSWTWVAAWWWYSGRWLVVAFPETAGPLALGLAPLLLPFFLAVACWYLARNWLPRGDLWRGRAAIGDSLWASFMPLTFVGGVAATLPTLLVL